VLRFSELTVTRRRELATLGRKANRSWSRWIYRGHRDANWNLETSLERRLKELGIPLSRADWAEGVLLREFQRGYGLHSEGVPPDDDLQWLSVMQHYGCPTRLLDWTYSFWAAVFFALERSEPKAPAAVWALDADWWRKRARATFPPSLRRALRRGESKDPHTMVRAFGRKRSVVWPANPFLLNERLAVQQGVFLAPGDPRLSFEASLQATAGSHKSDQHLFKITLKFSRQRLNRTMADLQRMNITRASLYPGLVGHAESLPWRLTLQQRYKGIELERGFGAFAE